MYLPVFAGLNLGAPLPVIVFIAALVGGFILTLIFAAWVHLWVYIFGGRKGIMQTVNAIIYGHTPRLLFGWIPVIGFIFTLWSLVLNIFGIRELQEISGVKATLALAIAIIIPLAIIVIAAAYFLISTVTMTGLPSRCRLSCRNPGIKSHLFFPANPRPLRYTGIRVTTPVFQQTARAKRPCKKSRSGIPAGGDGEGKRIRSRSKGRLRKRAYGEQDSKRQDRCNSLCHGAIYSGGTATRYAPAGTAISNGSPSPRCRSRGW